MVDSFTRSRTDLSAKTIKLYMSAVRDLEAYLRDHGLPLTVADITAEHIAAYMAYLHS